MATEEDEKDALLLLDRFVSASSSDDVGKSLEGLERAIQNQELSIDDFVHAKHTDNDDEDDPLRALLSVFHEETTTGKKMMKIESGHALAGRVYLSLLKKSTNSQGAAEILLQQPSEGRLLNAAIDVACDTTSTTGGGSGGSSSYPRVLSVQILSLLVQKQSKISQNQLLAAPNGLHRLGDLLKKEEDEQVRNEALLLAIQLSEFASISKVWMFDDMGDVVMQFAHDQGGLTNGNVLVHDALCCLHNLFKHDTSISELVVSSSPGFLQNGVGKLLDLRFGQEFMHPPNDEEKSGTEDDLDDLIANKKKEIVPRLKDSEEKIIQKVFDILSTILENETVKHMIWKQQPSIANLIWEMALITPPPPNMKFPCAMISVQLQQRALQMTSTYLNDMDLMQEFSGLDRLLYLVHTGNGSTSYTQFDDQCRISQSALHVLRRTLPDAVTNEMLMHTLAPPIEGGADGADNNQQQRPLPVQRIVNTVLENLVVSDNDDDDKDSKKKNPMRPLLLSGALGALSLFVTDEPRRSILLRLTSEKNMLSRILECLVNETDDFIALHLLKFLCTWVLEAPIVVQALLNVPQATNLSQLYLSKKDPLISAMTGTLLGLCMECMGDDESQCGGWTRAGILDLLKSGSGGITFLFNKLERIKNKKNDLPWSYCDLERDIWKAWYDRVVLVIRKRVVQELTAAGEEETDDDDDNNDAAGNHFDKRVNGKELKNMQKMVSEQSGEIEELRASLMQAQRKVESQEKQLATWKLRVESTPTQLDEMLNEYMAKNSELDQKVILLEEEKQRLVEHHESELNARDDRIAAIQQELKDCQAQEAVTRNERDTLQEDMTALSQAYTSLEEEFRRQSEAATATPQTPAGDHVGSELQSEGEESQQQQHQSGSTEVATLRAENSRMKKDAQEADDWMAMAVKRMETMGAENESLQQEVSNLRAQINQASAAAQASGGETAQLLSFESETRIRLEQELAGERSQREQMQSQIQAIQAEAEAAAGSLEETKLDRERLQADVSAPSQQLQSAHGDNEEIDSMRASLEGLKQELSASREEIQIIQRREQEEMQRRDLRIEELQQASQSASPDDIRSRDEEIQQLREANEEAQKWMAKAVEHHRVLSDQVESLSQQNSELQARIDELKSLPESTNSVSDAAAERFNEEVEARDLEISHLKEHLASLQEQVEQFETQASRSTDLEHELANKQAQFDALRAEAVVKDQEIELLRGQIVASKLGEEFADRSSEVESLTIEIADRDERLKLLEEEVDELQATKEKLLHKVSDLEATKIEFGTTEEEIELLRARASEAEARHASIEKILDAVAREKKEMTAEAQKNRDALEKIEAELTTLREAELDTTQSSEIGENFNELQQKIKNMEAQLVDQQEEATGVIQQWEETYNALQTKNTDTEQKLKDSLEEKERLTSEIMETKQAVQELRAQLEKSGEQQMPDGRISELEVTVKNLQDQMRDQETDTEAIVSQWQESYNALELQHQTLTAERDAMVAKLEGSKSTQMTGGAEKATEASERSSGDRSVGEDLEKRIRDLEQQLADQEVDASAVVSRWQESFNEIEARLEETIKEKEALSLQLTDMRTSPEEPASQSEKQRDAAVFDRPDSGSERVLELEATVKDLEEQLATQEAEATSIVTQWQESHADVVAQLETTHSELEEAKESLREIHSKQEQEHSNPEMANIANSDTSSERVLELKAAMKDLEERLETQEAEATSVVTQWQESYTEVAAQLETTSAELEEAKESLKEIHSKQGQNNPETTNNDDVSAETAELKSTIQSLEAKLESQENEAQEVLRQWQQNCEDVKAELNVATAELQDSRMSISQMQAEMDEAKTKAEANSEVASSLETTRARVVELEENVKNLEEQLHDQEQDANNDLSQWQQSYEELSAQLDAANAEKEKQALELQRASDAAQSAEQEEQKCRETIAELESTLSSLQQQVTEKEIDANSIVVQWQQSYEDVKAQLDAVSLELQKSEGEVANLQNDDIRNALQDKARMETAVADLESIVSSLQQQLADKETKANAVVSQWQQSYEDVKAQFDDVTIEIKKSQETIVERDRALQDALQAKEQNASRVEELNSTVEKLEEDAAERYIEISKMQQEYDALQAHVDAATLEPQRGDELDAKVGGDHPEDQQLNTEELQEKIQDLEAELQQAFEVVAQWQESYNELSSKLEAAEKDAGALRHKLEQSEETHGTPDHSTVQLKATIEQLQQQLKEQEEHSIAIVEQWQTSYEGIKSELDAISGESLKRQPPQNDLAADGSAFSDVERNELISKVDQLEKGLKEQEEKASRTELQLQVDYQDVSKQVEELLEENAILRSDLKVSQERQSQLNSEINADDFAALQAKVADLEQMLSENEEEARGIVAQWQDSYENVKTQLEAKEREVIELREGASVLEDKDQTDSPTPECDTDRITELEALVDELRNQLSNHDEDALRVVSQWQESYAALEDRLGITVGENEELSLELKKLQEEVDLAQQLASVAGASSEESGTLREKLEDMTLKLGKARNDKQVVENQAEDLKRELSARQSQVEELREQLADAHDGAARSPQTQISALESRINEHLETIYRLQCNVDQEKREKVAVEQDLVTTKERYNAELDAARSEAARVKESAEADRLMDREKLGQLEHDYEVLRSTNASLENDRDELAIRVAELKNDLREANDTLQLHLTNEVSGKATDIAAQMLRKQLDDMRSQAHEDQVALSEEREAREVAEAEAERLRVDLAALLGMEENEENSGAIRQRTMEATESFQRAERAEINSLRKALDKALEELAAARAMEHQLEERAAKANHQAILYEQEVVNAKGDFKFLTQTMDELREAESTKRAALEYRISKLESDQNVLRKLHSAEMENIRNELSHVNMERDRLFHALKESEKNKEVLINASSRDLQVGEETDPYGELARLRIERAQLLSAASEEASRIERQIRQTRAAAKASAEADVILEKKLRVAAEQSLESVKLELEELRAEMDKENRLDVAEASREQLLQLQGQLEDLKRTNEAVSDECESLRKQLDENEKKSKLAIERLTEECRQAKARASHLERDGHYEAEIRAEVARLQASKTNVAERGIVVHQDPAEENQEDAVALTKLYDVIKKQKQAIEEERSVYFELLSEHDGLLALLAQQNMLKSSLTSALSAKCGQDAVDAAVSEAEERAKEKYGKYVKLS